MTNCLFFGDSITYGENDGVLGGWVDNLKRYCHGKYYNENANKVNIFNLGIGGETTEGLLNRFETEFLARKSLVENLIFLSYGTNDLAIIDNIQIVNKQKFKNNLQFVIDIAKKTTNKIFLVSILPVSLKIEGVVVATGKLRTTKAIREYNMILQMIAKENSLTFIDTFSGFNENREENLSKDGVHPNEKGYHQISEFIKPVIEKYL